MSNGAFRRTRMPIGGTDVLVFELAQCLAGETKACRVTLTVKRKAWFMAPAWTSSYRTSPGKTGRPAASAEVQYIGRSASLVMSNSAPEPHCQLPSGCG